MRGESFTFGETRRTQQMRAKKHLREEALEAMRQKKRARVDEVEVVQEHSLQLMSRVAEPGRSAPITIWARLQALKRTLASEAEARFLHVACERGSSSTTWRLVIKKKLMSAPAHHRASKPEWANSLLRRLLWVTFALLIGALWSWFTEFARPSRWPTGASSPSLSRLSSTHG